MQSATTLANGGGGRSIEALWQGASERLKRQLSVANYSTWFARVQPVGIEGDLVRLGVPNLFTKQWIESHHGAALEEAMRAEAGRGVTVTLLALELPPDEEIDLTTVPPGEPHPATRAPAPAPSDRITDGPGRFHPKYVFESFVIGSSNRFAHAAALAVAEAPASAYNPLLIYGGAGLGKTHLLQAIGSYVRTYHPEQAIRYISTEQFLNDFIVALQRRTIPDFHRHYRAVDILLVDDIQFLEGKEHFQEEFFHTFNALHPSSQVVLSSDRPPKKISTLEERLRTRFEWGLITDVQPPDLETRLAILQKKSETDDLPVPPDVMAFIASKIQTNIRELEGALIRVAAYASLTRSEVTLDLAQNVLQSLLYGGREARVTEDLVISLTADYFGLTDEEIRSPNRSRPLVHARQIAMYLCRELTDLSLPRIGDRFGGRDHSTVIHADKKIRKLLQERRACYEQVQELTERIRQQAARG